MTQTALLAGNEQHVNFLNIFVRPKKNIAEPEAVQVKNPILNWFEKTNFLLPLEFNTIPAGEIFQSDRVIVKLKLSGAFDNDFVLLRGLLEFSRPKEIFISSNRSQKTFELHLRKDQAVSVTTYLDTILSLLIKEIKFKKTLKDILRFEQSIRKEQSQLYKELWAAVQ